MTQPDYQLVATQFSYYSAKVRACLQYKRLPYEEILCNYDAMFNRVLPATGEAKFPVIFCADGTVLKDSCDIVEALERRHPARPVIPEDGLLRLVSVLIETLADEFLAAPFIYYRWVPEDTKAWALDLFRLMVTSGLEKPEDIANAAEISQLVAAGVQDRVQKVGQDRADVQEESQRITHAVCDALERHLATTPFILGQRPCLADLALMNGLFGHLYMDPCEASMYIRRHCTRLSLWIMRMHSAYGESDRGELLLPETTADLLVAMARPFRRFALDILNAVDDRVKELAPDTDLPATLGRVDTMMNDTPVSAGASPYIAWKLQRLRDAYQSLSGAQCEQADALLAHCGFLEVCRKPLSWRLEKRGAGLILQRD